MPPVNLDNLPDTVRHMASACPDLPPPRIFEKQETRQIEPSVVISFDAVELENNSLMQLDAPHLLFVADIFFNYGGIKVKAEDTYHKLIKEEGKTLVEIPRHGAREKELLAEIAQILALRAPTLTEKLWCEYEISHEKVLANFHQEEDLSKLYKNVLPLFEKSNGQSNSTILFIKKSSTLMTWSGFLRPKSGVMIFFLPVRNFSGWKTS